MSTMKKRISAFLLSLAMVTAVALPTFADDTQSYTPMQISAESEAFPQAYIEIENGTTLMARDGTTHLSGASVTVYYEEHYKYDSQGNLFITDSRLLSEDEVNAIGKENFDEGAPWSVYSNPKLVINCKRVGSAPEVNLQPAINNRRADIEVFYTGGGSGGKLYVSPRYIHPNNMYITIGSALPNGNGNYLHWTTGGSTFYMYDVGLERFD